MAQKTTPELKAFADANINTNGTNSIAGSIHNIMLTDMFDSFVNKLSDGQVDATNLYRSGSQAITTVETQINFTSNLANNNYEVFIIDPNGTGWENITDKQVGGFKITGQSSGTIGFLVILNN